MIRPDRPFDRWFDLLDAYDADAPPPKRRQERPREWTYAPARPDIPKDTPQPEPTRTA